ncbi:fibronectin type III domain-containing protein [Luteolibacter arcticus]|uniref:Fibronectin type III domain-containing protein n=1 Tax=Luteolibacter arcticus TaxID=1581411 RepID=A0ABT3GMM6_9BACT|nr:fibronectin type III domain-containing protein [Luteolibacter arcticus]MCW1924759.1 fibronectin type III domain-containing protein [Luteolibacter arcticus]
MLSVAACPFIASAAVIPSEVVSLEWNANPEPNVVGYKVYFGTQSGDYSAVIDVAGATQTELPAVSLGTTYYLAVSAYNAAGEEGPRSSELAVTAEVPSPVADTSMSFDAPGQGQLQWRYPKSNVPAADKFTIYASEDLKTWQPAGSLPSSAASSSDADWLYFRFPYASDKPRMFFRVGSSNAFGEFQ